MIRKIAGSHSRGHTFLVLVLLLTTLCPNAVAERLPIKSYTVADGLAHDRVRRIIRDSRGFLWICTVEGLSRFDGYRFVNYGVEHGLPGGNVSNILETRSGQYWVATTNGVGRLNPSATTTSLSAGAAAPRFTSYTLGNTAQSNSVGVLFEDSSGQLFAGTIGGLFRWVESEGTFQRMEQGLLARPNCNVVNLAEDSEGSLWIGSTLGLMRLLPDGRLLSFSMRWPENEERVNSTNVRADRDGRLWMRHNNGLVVFRPEPAATAENRDVPWIRHTRHKASIQTSLGGRNRNGNLGKSDLPAPNLTLAPGEARLFFCTPWSASEAGLVFHQTAEGQIWIGTDLGLLAFDGMNFRSYTTDQGLTENVVVALNEDSDGNLWAGGFSTGVMKIVRQGLTSFTTADGVGNTRVVDIAGDLSGAVYACSANWIISGFDGQRFTAIQPQLASPMPAAGWRFTQSSFQDHLGEWWTATSNGLYRFPRTERFEQLASARPIAVYTRRDGLPGDIIGYFFEDSRGDLWLGTNGRPQLVRWERATNTFRPYSQSDGVPSGAPQTFCQAVNGDIWIGFADGLARYREGRFSVWTADHGLPKGTVRHLYSDHLGRIWISSSLGGLGCIEEPGAPTPTFKIYGVAEGLSSNATRCATEDKWGRIYVGVGRGVDRLDPATGRIKHYTTSDGLANSFVSSAFRDRDGQLWFGMLQGLSRLIPEPDRPAEPVAVWINNVQIAGAAYPISEFGERTVSLPSLDPEQNRIQVNFFGMSFSAGEPLKYQYKLEGAGQDWSDPTEQRTHEMSLGPGSYRFLVRAVRGESPIDSIPASVSFKILPPIWLRWWFITIGLLAVALGTFGIARYRSQRAKAAMEAQEALRRSREERFAELERVRRRIATDLHDDIGSSLTQISIMSEVVRQRTDPNDSQLSGPLSMIAGASRELVDSMSDIVWAINPQKDHLNDLAQRMRRFASDLLTARNIAFEFVEPDEEDDVPLGANIRREVFLIFKESVNNLVRHSGCTDVRIDFDIANGVLKLRVRDDGKGFDISQNGDGHGLASMRQRAEDMGGQLEIISKSGEGTTIQLDLPIAGG
ncbi:MAG TPA: two-component regulator propeller domain-containing protein [Blastocatellia bacterium]|nr:two-component regulator propeller domain-containing protein [Blastocatellia bacterium]